MQILPLLAGGVFCGLITTVLLADDDSVHVRRIWDRAAHQAFTDLVKFDGRLYCTFREGSAHVHGDDGEIRIIVSEDDGQTWKSVALLKEEGVDLRDPKITVTPDGRLMVNMGASTYEDRVLKRREPRVSFSDATASSFQEDVAIHIDADIRSDFDWLWRVTWHQRAAWGVVYRTNRPDDEFDTHLLRSDDGIHFERVTSFEIPGRPNETTIRFVDNGSCVALMRRERGDQKGWVGTSDPPYTRWTWHSVNVRLGGPNFIELLDGTLIAATRSYESDGTHTTLARLTTWGAFDQLIKLPSAGDTSYAGMVLTDDLLYVSYYSSHEGKTAIYLATIPVELIGARVRGIPIKSIESEEPGRRSVDD